MKYSSINQYSPDPGKHLVKRRQEEKPRIEEGKNDVKHLMLQVLPLSNPGPDAQRKGAEGVNEAAFIYFLTNLRNSGFCSLTSPQKLPSVSSPPLRACIQEHITNVQPAKFLYLCASEPEVQLYANIL